RGWLRVARLGKYSAVSCGAPEILERVPPPVLARRLASWAADDRARASGPTWACSTASAATAAMLRSDAQPRAVRGTGTALGSGAGAGVAAPRARGGLPAASVDRDPPPEFHPVVVGGGVDVRQAQPQAAGGGADDRLVGAFFFFKQKTAYEIS